MQVLFLCLDRCHTDNIYLHPRYLCDHIVHCLLSEDDESICDEVSMQWGNYAEASCCI